MGYPHHWTRGLSSSFSGQLIQCFFPRSQVQSDHYEEFFAPELDKHGYQALYKRKTNEVLKTTSPHCHNYLCVNYNIIT